MATYFIADTHFGHENIITLCNRPFTDLTDMNTTLAQNWNARVRDQDDIYIVGDFWYRGSGDGAVKAAKQLKGRKHLITGNHDKKFLSSPAFQEQFVEVEELLSITHDGARIVLCHYPLAEWEGYYRGSWHIYGHIHNNRNEAFAYMKTQERALNAGVEITQYMPVTFAELKLYNEIFKNS